MSRKNKLFSIGEIAKFTGASIKSLRYYEELKILKPAFVDGGSGYRYYSFDQIYLIDLIMFCIELDIPLKELTGYIDKNGTLDYSSLLADGKSIAEKKLKTIQRGLEFIENTQEKIALAEKYNQELGFYTREIQEKYFYVIPCEQPEYTDLFELAKPFLDLEYNEDDFHDREFGYMCEYSPSGIQRYAFMEIPNYKEKANCKIIPSGVYFCRQNEESQIEQTPQIFSKQLEGKKHFLSIETEIFTSKYKINKPINELRVIGLK
ncbi:MAG: MerR family transcriptional regulator [Treponema sp.]|nr:MerR family transcriptional regulator [Treponema sp.]